MKGFLPTSNPKRNYSKTSSAPLNRLHEITSNLPKLLLTNKVTKVINSLKRNDLSVEELIESTQRNKSQLTEWLKRAVDDEQVKKLNRPVRYQVKNKK